MFLVSHIKNMSLLFILLLSLLVHQGSAQSAKTCASAQIDMVICLDGSGSMGSSYPEVQQFAKDVIDKFTISSTNTRVAVLRYVIFKRIKQFHLFIYSSIYYLYINLIASLSCVLTFIFLFHSFVFTYLSSQTVTKRT